ncbi:MAG: diguanylate cyclase [Gammaproteobacteria bacterium]|nr:diguanylate cyclase [Gammaproteobacteria bacterium]
MNGLVIEPSKMYQQLLSQMITAAGATCFMVSSGSEGVKLAQQKVFDFVFIAGQIDDMDSAKFIHKLRSVSRYEKTPIMMITSNNDESIRKESFRSGITEILSKDNLPAIERGVNTLVNSVQQKLRAKVLYIEDSKSIGQLTMGIMDDAGMDVDWFDNAEEAMESFHNNDYDIVVTDIELAGKMTGFGVVNAVKNAEGFKKRIPVLAVSGSDDYVRRVELLKQGANDFITKPTQEDELIARMKNLVTTKQLFDQVQEQQDKLYEMATKDSLTGCFNRHSLAEFAPKYLSEAYRFKTSLSMMVIDLDHFKLVNDNHGHAVGDIVLKETGELLQSFCREEDMVARFGGEEFVVILGHCDLDNAKTKAERLRKSLMALKPHGLTVTASIGLTTLPEEVVGFDDLFKMADAAVYEAKETGRNRVCVNTQGHELQCEHVA